jgi:hypothetical protein
MDLDDSRDVTRGYPKEYAKYLAREFNAGNQQVIQRYHTDHKYDYAVDALTPR